MKRALSMRELQEWVTWFKVSSLAHIGLGLGLGGNGDGLAPGSPQTTEQQQAIWAEAAAAFARARGEQQ
jgi:hypothetical protein